MDTACIWKDCTICANDISEKAKRCLLLKTNFASVAVVVKKGIPSGGGRRKQKSPDPLYRRIFVCLFFKMETNGESTGQAFHVNDEFPDGGSGMIQSGFFLGKK